MEARYLQEVLASLQLQLTAAGVLDNTIMLDGFHNFVNACELILKADQFDFQRVILVESAFIEDDLLRELGEEVISDHNAQQEFASLGVFAILVDYFG